MNAKLVALALLIALVLGASLVFGPHQGSKLDAGELAAIHLVPAQINGYAIQKQWENSLSGERIEQGASYATAGGDPVQLDFIRNSPHNHNGVVCFLLKGELLRSQAIRTVETRSGKVDFDVAIIQAENRLRLAATTECGVAGCTETILPYNNVAFRSAGIGFKDLLGEKHASVVPVSLVLERDQSATPDNAGGADDAEQKLLSEFLTAAADIDLAPAQKLAAALDQPGAS